MQHLATPPRPYNHMTPRQAASACALARAYGHYWAGCPGVDGLCSVAEIEALSRATEETGEPGALMGIRAPSLDASGRVVHETMSGRLIWTVDRDGNVLVDVRRPFGTVIRAEIYRSVGAGMVVSVLEHDEPNVRYRHVDALTDVAFALGVSTQERQRVWAKFPGAAAEEIPCNEAALRELGIVAPRPPITLSAIVAGRW